MAKRRKSSDSSSSEEDVKPKVESSDSSSSDDDEDWNAKGTKPKAKRGRPVKKVKQEKEEEVEEKEEGEVEDDEDESDDEFGEEFNDGYDENLLGDEEDQKRLAQMTEKEREQELFNRSEKREVLKTRFEIEKKLRLAKKKEQNKVASEAAMRSTERRRNVEDKRKVKDAIKGLRAEREKKKQKQQKKLTTADVYSSDSDSDDEDNKNFSRRKSSSSSSSSISSSDDSDVDTKGKIKMEDIKREDDDYDDNQGSDKDAEEDWVFTLEHLNKLRLTRHKLGMWCHSPFFKDTVIGCFVRVSLGVDQQTKQPCYRVVQIVDVTEINSVYAVDPRQSNIRTNKGLKVRHGKSSERIFKLAFVSNSEFTKSEYERWYQSMITDKCEFPSKEMFEKKKQDISNALNYHYNDEDINLMIEEKAKFKRLPVNFAVMKTNLLKEREAAEMNGDLEKVNEIYKKLEELEDQAKKIEKQRTQNIAGISYINERNRMRNIKEAERALSDEACAKKSTNAQDPFTRRKCTPTMVHIFRGKKSLEIKNETLAELNIGSETDNLPLEHISFKEEPGTENNSMNGDSTNNSRSEMELNTFSIVEPKEPLASQGHDDNDLFSAHNFEINFDFNIDPVIQPGNSNNSVAGGTSSSNSLSASKAPNRRSLNLDEYKKKKGLI